MTSPFWHTQHGVSSPLWDTQPRAPHRHDPPNGNLPNNTRPRGANTSGHRTRVETQCHLVPSVRPPIRSRYTSPEDEPTPNTSQRSRGSPGRVYSSPTRPQDQCQSPIMTLRVLPPSQHGARDDKKQADQENRQFQDSAQPPATSPGLTRSANTKQSSPKRRRLPLRDSILLKRKSSPEVPKADKLTLTSTVQNPPLTPGLRDGQEGKDGLPPTPTAPSKSRLKGFPRLGAFSRDHKPPPLQETWKPPRPPRPDEVVAAKELPVTEPKVVSEATPETDGRLVSRICTMILDEGIGAAVDRSSMALKVWDAVSKCLNDISPDAQVEVAGKPKEPISASEKTPREMTSSRRSSLKSPWPPESWGARDDKATIEPKDRQTSEHHREGHEELTAEALSRLASLANEELEKSTGVSAPPLPCPFRARNPARFNVNDNWPCAKGQWKSIPELQQHITRHHRHPSDSQLFHCPRCEKGFSQPGAFKKHLMLPREQMCDPRSDAGPPISDPEDGITAGRARALSEGVERGKIGSWDDLWKCLFPEDRMVPRPAVLPAIELPQVEQEVFASSNMSNLKTNVEERLRFLSSQSGNGDLFTSLIPVISGSVSLVVEAHLRSVFISCRTQPSRTNRSRSASQTRTQETPTNRPRKLSSASASSAKALETMHRRGPTAVVTEAKSSRGGLRPVMQGQRSVSDGSVQTRSVRTATLPVPSTLTIPFPRISALTDQSDAGPSPASEGNASPKGNSSDAEYSSGVESNPTSAGGLRDSSNTDIRCSKCNMRPSLRPNEDIFAGRRLSELLARGAQGDTCRFSDSGIGILCKSCRMLEELINSYSRASTQSGKSERRDERKGAEIRRSAPPPLSPDPSLSIDENDEETLFDLILDSATYVDENGQRKTQLVSPMFPPPRQELPQPGLPKYDRYGHDRNFF